MNKNNLKFEVWSNEWLQFHQSKVKVNSVQMYKSKVKLLNDYFKGQNITKITSLEIQEYLNCLAYEYKFSLSTIKKYRITLNKIFKYAMQNRAIQRNPVDITDLPKTIAKSCRRCLTEDEIKIIIDNANIEFGLYVLTLLYTGLRRSECLALRWEDINFEKGKICICKSITFIHSKPIVDYRLKNGDSERYIPLPLNLKKELIKYQKKTGWLFVITSYSIHYTKLYEFILPTHSI